MNTEVSLKSATPENHDESTKIALERYRNIIGYLQYENQTYWTRVGFIFASQAALIGFGSRLIVDAISKGVLVERAVVTGFVVLGLLLCFIGFKMTKGAKRWISRWENVLVVLEPKAYGEQHVFRKCHEEVDGAGVPGLRDLANAVLYLFVFTWIALLIALYWPTICR